MMKKEHFFLYGLVAVIILFLIINIGFVIFASHQEVSLVSDNYYEKELKYQDRIDRLDRAKALGLDVHVQTNLTDVGIQYPPHFADGVIRGSLHFFRPSDKQLDRTFPINLQSGLIQTIPRDEIASGRWILYVDWTQQGQSYSLQKDLYVE